MGGWGEGRGLVQCRCFDRWLHDSLQRSVPIILLQALFGILTCFLLDLPASGVQAVSLQVSVQSLAQRRHHTRPKA